MAIADSYKDIYDGIEFRNFTLIEPLLVIEFKADFDVALDTIGKGNWTGHIEDKRFEDFRYFGRLQRVVIADIYGVPDEELERLGFYQIPRVRGLAYRWIANHLNGLPFRGSQTRFVAKPLDKGG